MAQQAQIPDNRIEWPPGHVPASAVVFAQNKIEISADPQAVWSLLIDCTKWPRWYKHCADVSMVSGGSVLGSDSQFRFKTLGFFFEPKITTFRPNEMLVWAAKGPAGTSGAHAWFIESTPGGCRVITEEAQKGALLYLLRSRTRRELLTSHAEWLRALKERAESKSMES